MLLIMCMPGAMNNVLSDGNHMNSNITTSSSSFSTTAVAVAYPWVRHVYVQYLIGYSTTYYNKSFSFLYVSVLLDWVPYGKNASLLPLLSSACYPCLGYPRFGCIIQFLPSNQFLAWI